MQWIYQINFQVLLVRIPNLEPPGEALTYSKSSIALPALFRLKFSSACWKFQLETKSRELFGIRRVLKRRLERGFREFSLQKHLFDSMKCTGRTLLGILSAGSLDKKSPQKSFRAHFQLTDDERCSITGMTESASQDKRTRHMFEDRREGFTTSNFKV